MPTATELKAANADLNEKIALLGEEIAKKRYVLNGLRETTVLCGSRGVFKIEGGTITTRSKQRGDLLRPEYLDTVEKEYSKERARVRKEKSGIDALIAENKLLSEKYNDYKFNILGRLILLRRGYEKVFKAFCYGETLGLPESEWQLIFRDLESQRML